MPDCQAGWGYGLGQGGLRLEDRRVMFGLPLCDSDLQKPQCAVTRKVCPEEQSFVCAEEDLTRKAASTVKLAGPSDRISRQVCELH